LVAKGEVGDIDATQIDPAALRFEPSQISHAGRRHVRVRLFRPTWMVIWIQMQSLGLTHPMQALPVAILS
jgi:hypothetical protein